MKEQSILVVDDHIDTLDAVRDILEHAGYAVVTARNGREALELLRAGLRPWLALLDLAMPGMGGAELLRAMQSDAALSGIPVVFITSDPSCAPPGSRVLRKPIRIDDLLREARAFCSRP